MRTGAATLDTAAVKSSRTGRTWALFPILHLMLALVPVLTSTGRGADITVPMAIPSFGGMTVAVITLFVVPVLYCMVEEVRLGTAGPESQPGRDSSP